MTDSKMPVSMAQIQEMRFQNIGRFFLRAHRLYSQIALTKLRERGYTDLTQAHTALLANLAVEGTRITTLAERAGMTKQSMGQLVIDLEQQGYVQRVDDPTDKRAALVKFTDKGMVFLSDAYELKQEIEAEFKTILGEEGLSQLFSLLNTLVNQPQNGQEVTDAF